MGENGTITHKQIHLVPFMLQNLRSVTTLVTRSAMAQKSIVLYHYPCPDGISAALAAYMYHKQHSLPIKFLPNRTFNPLTVSDLHLEGNEIVYLLDFSGPPGFASLLASACKQCIILDHHKSAAEELTNPTVALPSNLTVHFDMNKSGATIALDHFKPDNIPQKTLDFFRYIEDADLWRWALPESKAFHCGFNSLGLEFDATKNDNQKLFDQLLSIDPIDMINRGRPILKHRQQRIDDAIRCALVVQLGGRRLSNSRKALAVIAGDDTELASYRSELGNQLAEESEKRGHAPVGVIAYKEIGMKQENCLKVSLRSLREEDTTVISTLYGGGGHRNASGFVIDKEEFERSWMHVD